MIKGHGDDLYLYKGLRNRINFSSNVCGGTDRAGLEAHLQSRLSALISAYPEPEPYSLEAELAAFYGVDCTNISVTSGATEGIYLIAQLFHHGRSAVLQPTFSEYADAAKVHNHTVTNFFSLEELPQKADIIWLCNPNNPTGRVWDTDMLQSLIRQNPDKVFVIDQSYEYFTLKELFTVKEATEWPNVILLHSMTKRYAIPGIRLGYITADRCITDRLKQIRMPWSVNALAIEAGLYLLSKKLPGTLNISSLLKESQVLRENIGRISGFQVEPTDTHYFLAHCNRMSASELKQHLISEHGILIRDASNFMGLNSGHFRIAAQTPKQNDKLLYALKSL